MCASASFSVVKVVGSRPASVRPCTHFSVSTTRGSVQASLPCEQLCRNRRRRARFDQRLVHEMGARIGPVTDAERHRCHALRPAPS